VQKEFIPVIGHMTKGVTMLANDFDAEKNP
jgi:hypothetical protein